MPSLLKARRPPYAPSTNDPAQRARKPRVEVEESPGHLKNVSGLPESPEEGKVFQASWEINVKDLVGDAVGNVRLIIMGDNSMPTFYTDEYKPCFQGHSSCCVSLRAPQLSSTHVTHRRRGLFIIDLESPFNLPRFLPQGGTWDVADVQWNPHHSHAQYIVSTSSEKM